MSEPQHPDTPPPGPDYGGGTGAPPPDYGGGYGTPPGGYGAGGYGGGGYGGGGYGDGGNGGGYAGPPGPGESYGVGAALTYGWTKFTQNLGPILLLSLVLFIGVVVFGAVGSFLQAAIAPSESGLWARQSASAVFSLLNFFVSTLLGAFVIRGALDLTEGRPLDVGGIFSRIPIAQMLLLALITSVVTAVGFALCILPGIVALLFFYFASYFLLDRDLTAVDAIKASVDLVRRRPGDAIVWAIVAFLVSIVGVCLCVVGLLVTYPVSMIGTAYTYKRLTGQPVAP